MTDTSHDRHQLDRLIFFSDAVFAIAMTLLVVDVRLPPLRHVSEAALAQALVDLVPQYIGFFISFLVVGRFWIGHHRAFGWLQRSDDRFVWLNLLFLLTIAFMPFPTTLISGYASTRIGVGVYAGWLIVAGLANVAVERHAAKAGLARPGGEAQVPAAGADRLVAGGDRRRRARLRHGHAAAGAAAAVPQPGRRPPVPQPGPARRLEGLVGGLRRRYVRASFTGGAMARAALRYVCQACGAVSSRWQGQCAECAEWNTIQQEAAAVVTAFSAKHSLSSGGRGIGLAGLDDDVAIPARATSGIAELDRALGGGLVAGSAVLIGGDPGIGKSTLLLQAAGRMALGGIRVAYISGEEAADQVRLRARRLGLAKAPVALASATSVRDILTTLNAGPPPGLVVIDSIQTMHSDTLEGAPGTVSQVRAAAQELIRYAKTSGAALVLVGHVTKDGQIAGPRVLEHMVDTVLYFEGERSHQYRILRAVKNRFGGTDEIGVFAMGADGLEEVANPSSLFLTDRDQAVSGAVVFPALEGTRPVLVEIQALVVRLPSGATPRRAVVGWDSARLAMILAVLESRCGLSFSSCEVYLNVAGGLRINDPAADLAVAAALVSALSETPVGADTVVFGEIALSGEVRGVGHALLRLKEAAKLGFTGALVPAVTEASGGLRTAKVRTVAALVDRLARP